MSGNISINMSFCILAKKGGLKEVWRESRMSADNFIYMCWLSFSFYGVLSDSYCMNNSHLFNRLYCINLNVHIILYIGFLS